MSVSLSLSRERTYCAQIESNFKFQYTMSVSMTVYRNLMLMSICRVVIVGVCMYV